MPSDLNIKKSHPQILLPHLFLESLGMCEPGILNSGPLLFRVWGALDSTGMALCCSLLPNLAHWPLPTGQDQGVSPTLSGCLLDSTGADANIPSSTTHFEASGSQSSVFCRISFNPHNSLGVDPYYHGCAAAGATSEVRGSPWVTRLVPGPALCQDFGRKLSSPAHSTPSTTWWPSWGHGGPYTPQLRFPCTAQNGAEMGAWLGVRKDQGLASVPARKTMKGGELGGWGWSGTCLGRQVGTKRLPGVPPAPAASRQPRFKAGLRL